MQMPPQLCFPTTLDPDLVIRRAEIIADIEEAIAQLDRGEFVTEDQLRARFQSEREARLRRDAL